MRGGKGQCSRNEDLARSPTVRTPNSAQRSRSNEPQLKAFKRIRATLCFQPSKAPPSRSLLALREGGTGPARPFQRVSDAAAPLACQRAPGDPGVSRDSQPRLPGEQRLRDPVPGAAAAPGQGRAGCSLGQVESTGSGSPRDISGQPWEQGTKKPRRASAQGRGE